MSSEKLDLIPENQALLKESLLWDEQLSLRAALGYKDNVSLSPAADSAPGGGPVGSTFTRLGLDFAVNRLALDGLGFSFVLTGDDTRYWHPVPVDREDLFLADARVEKYFGSDWRADLDLKASYVREVQYVLVAGTGGGPTNELISGYTLEARPSVRWDFSTGWWLGLEGDISRWFFGAPLDNSWRFGPRLTLGRTYGFDSSVAVSYAASYEPHNTLPAVDSTGQPLVPETKLAAWRHRADLTWQHHWDKPKHWRSTAKFEFDYYADNGEGFYNYDRYSIGEDLRYYNKGWELKCGARVAYEHYPVQMVDLLDPASPKLHRIPLDVTARAERRLAGSMTVYAEYEYERAFSNSSSEEYSANTVSGGISLEF